MLSILELLYNLLKLLIKWVFRIDTEVEGDRSSNLSVGRIL